jgi:CheY-like chemotaxis protein
MLIIEDDIGLLDALSDVLELAGYSIKRALNDREALDFLRKPPWPAVILLDRDLGMSVISGGQFLARKRNHPGLVRVPWLPSAA